MTQNVQYEYLISLKKSPSFLHKQIKLALQKNL